MRDVKAVAKKLSRNRRNMNIHLYSIKLSRDNFITLLYLYKPLNYELSLMRNDYILRITLSFSLRNRRSKNKNKKRLNEEREVIEH